MRNTLLTLLQQKTTPSDPVKNKLDNYVQKLSGFFHAPASIREAKRIRRFSTDSNMIELIADTLANHYPVWEQQDGYDMAHYWYCITLLCFNPSPKIVDRLFTITKNMVKWHFEDIHLLQRTFNFFPDVAALNSHRKAIEDFYAEIAPTVESLQWIQHIGLPEPMKEWEISFELSTDGERKYEFALTPEEKESRFELVVTVNSVAKGNGHSWWLSLYNSNKTIRALWTRPGENSIRIHDTVQHLAIKPTLLHFSQTLAQLEAMLHTKFVRKPVHVYFSRGLKDKSVIERWVASL